MILVDTSIWVGHLRAADAHLSKLIASDQIIHHAFVTGEIGMGSFASPDARSRVIAFFRGFEQVTIVSEPAFHEFVSTRLLYGTGAGFIDCHLLASVARSDGILLWTSDKRLEGEARRIGVPLYR